METLTTVQIGSDTYQLNWENGQYRLQDPQTLGGIEHLFNSSEELVEYLSIVLPQAVMEAVKQAV